MELSAPDYIVLAVADIDRALAFWCDLLGLPLGHRSGPYAQLATGTTRLAFYQREALATTVGRPLAAPATGTEAFEVGFKVPDVDAAYGELVAGGATPVTAPADRPWGQRTAYVADPDGHLIELVTPSPLPIPATP